MSRHAPVFLAALVLAGCDEGAGQRADRSAAANTAAVEPARPAAPPPAPPGMASQSSPLAGDVSALVGDVSGLQGLVDALGGEIHDREIVVPLPADTLFDFDRSEIKPQAEPNLRTLVELLGKTDGLVQVIGHTDAVGDDAYNLALSKRRADAVATWLVARGGQPATRFRATGRGETQPASPETTPGGADDPAARARNRRVEVVIAR